MKYIQDHLKNLDVKFPTWAPKVDEESKIINFFTELRKFK